MRSVKKPDSLDSIEDVRILEETNLNKSDELFSYTIST